MRQLGVAEVPAIAPGAVAQSDSSAYRVYVIAVIWFVLLLRFVDLQIISILLQPIKEEFKVSDTQLGLLTGFAFSVLYGTLGIPVAWLADRYNRRNIIAVALGLWSGMTALCGMATSFFWLLLARVGVGIGEAGGNPPAYSLISDYVPAHRRASVFAILNSAVPFGVFVGMLVGGYVGAAYGWRTALLAVGLPGVLAALVVRFTIREPARAAGTANSAGQSVPFRETVSHLIRIRSYRHLVLGSSLFTLGAMGSGAWIPSFFMRVHELPPTTVATWLAFVYGGGGVIGAILGGHLADRIVERTGDRRWFAWLSGACAAFILPIAFFVYLSPAPIPALIAHTGVTMLMHAWLGPVYGTVQSLAGAKRRAMAAALNLLVINLLSYGMGPLFVGAASDYFAARFGNESLRYSILSVVVIAYGWAAVHFVLAARTIRADLRAAEEGDAALARN